MVNVYVCIIGDLFHFGHVHFLEQASKLGDNLIVGVLDDEISSYMKRPNILNLNERCKVIESCRYVDEVIKGCELRITREFIEQHQIDIVCINSRTTSKFIKDFYEVPLNMKKLVIIEDDRKTISKNEIIKRVKFS